MIDYKDKIDEKKIVSLIKEKLKPEFNKLVEDMYKQFLELKEQKDKFLDEAIKRMIEQPKNMERMKIVKSILKEKFQERKIFNIDLSDLFFELLIEMIKLDKDEKLEIRDTIFEEKCYKCY